MRQSSESYNLVVIGGGSAGLVSSYIAATVKAKVALIERHKMGGDCLNTGCVPSKALIKTAKIVAQIRDHAKYGIKAASFELDFPAVMARVKQVIREIEPHDSIDRYTDLGVECIAGEARILDKYRVSVGGRILTTKNIVLALGADPAIPPLAGLDQVPYRTSENLWDMRELPRRLVVLGGGPIGCEMAQAFQRLGSQVTQVETGSRLLGREDPEVSKLMTERLVSEGVQVISNARPTSVTRENGVTFVTIECPGQKPETVACDELLVAVGRHARTKGVDWSKLDIFLNANGSFKVDSYLRVNGDNIYACGDVIGPYQFTHVAAHQAWYCAVNALFSPLKKFKVDYRVIPQVTYMDPEIARVGLNEIEAKSAEISYEVTRYDLGDLDRAIVESEKCGFIKVLTVPGKDKILGATIIAPRAGEMITEFITAMKYGIGLNKILGTIHAYPTFAEANKYAAGVWKKAHAPLEILSFLEKAHAWRR